MSSRGRAGKYMKPKRGGGKHFSRDLRPVDNEGVEKSIWASDSDKDSSDEDSDDSSEESSGDEVAPKQPQEEMTREQRREAAKQRKQAAIAKKKGPVQVGDLPSDSESESSDDDMPANPNHTAKAAKMAAKPVVADEEEAPKAKSKKPTDMSQLSRREREALQAQQAKQRYEKLHAEGKTEQARNDLERLALVKQRREEDAARKAAEKAERDEHEKEKAEQLARMERQRAMNAAKKSRGGKKK